MGYPLWGLPTYVHMSCGVLLPQLRCCRWTWRGLLHPRLASPLSSLRLCQLMRTAWQSERDGGVPAGRECALLHGKQNVSVLGDGGDGHGKQGLRGALTRDLSQLPRLPTARPVSASAPCV